MINPIREYFKNFGKDRNTNESPQNNIEGESNIKEMESSYSQIIKNQNADEVEDLMSEAYANKNDDKTIDIIHQLIAEPWHRGYEEMAHYLQSCKRPESVPYLKNAMQKRYEYLESYGTGTRQFINQCGHALWSIGTEEAINSIRDLTVSDDPIIRDEMLYRISKIENRNDYERNYDLE